MNSVKVMALHRVSLTIDIKVSIYLRNDSPWYMVIDESATIMISMILSSDSDLFDRRPLALVILRGLAKGK